jgi:hypothetical protein
MQDLARHVQFSKTLVGCGMAEAEEEAAMG